MYCQHKKRVLRNLVHASDSEESAKREVDLWFNMIRTGVCEFQKY